MVDLPFRLLRPRFLQLWLPLTALAVLAAVPWQILTALGWFDTAPDGLPTLQMAGAWMIGIPITLVTYTVITAAGFGAVLDLLDGRLVDLWKSLRSLDLSRLGVVALLYVTMGLGTMCCIVPGMVLGAYLGLATPAVFVEGKSVGRAFQRSLDLVRGGRDGGWWSDVTARSLAVVIVTFILQYALNYVAMLPQTILIMKQSFESAASGLAVNVWETVPLWLNIATTLAAAGVLALVILYDAAGTLLVYRYARERLEGTGLETAIQDAQKQ
jgi:hypothetical protein